MKPLTKIICATIIGGAALIIGFNRGEYTAKNDYPYSWPSGITKSIDYALCGDYISLENLDDNLSYGSADTIDYVHNIMESLTMRNPKYNFFTPTQYNYDPMSNRVRSDALPKIVVRSFQELPLEYQQDVLRYAEEVVERRSQ
jgi:hypothetical protein